MASASALRSKDIQDYFAVDFSRFYAVDVLTFDIHLYFPHNNHIILVRASGNSLAKDYIQRKATRGLKEVWIHKDDQDAFIDYSLKAKEVAPDEFGAVGLLEDPFEEHNSLRSEMEEVLESQPTTQEGAIMAGVLNAPELTPGDKGMILEEAAKELLSGITDAEEVDQQESADRYARQVVGDVLASTSGLGGTTASEIWRLTNIEPRLIHSVNVSTYAVLFTVAAGRYDVSLISDIAMAGLLHDIGLGQVSATVTNLPWGELKTSQLKEYSRHVNEGIRLLGRLKVDLPPRVVQLLAQHHEKYDGSGYPNSLGGEAFALESQLLAMADLLVSISSGRWDGKPKTMIKALEGFREMLESDETHELFDPDLAARVLTWMDQESEAGVLDEAAQSVLEQAEELMETG